MLFLKIFEKKTTITENWKKFVLIFEILNLRKILKYQKYGKNNYFRNMVIFWKYFNKTFRSFRFWQFRGYFRVNVRNNFR